MRAPNKQISDPGQQFRGRKRIETIPTGAEYIRGGRIVRAPLALSS